MNDINKYDSNELLTQQVNVVVSILKSLGLPYDNIIANEKERLIISKNLPSYIQSLSPEIKCDARYLSKFIVGAGFGIFDYSLNSIWNEVVIALRKKAIAYGIEIFFDAALGGKLREAFKTEEDLGGLKDMVLLDTCKKLELISETTYKKLAHILDMRNDIGISHPSNYVINAFELLGWLQTCVQDVLNDKPSESAIQVKAFIDNLKKATEIIDQLELKTIAPHIDSLSSYHCSNILKTIFSIFVTQDTSSVLRKNISLLAPSIWNASPDEIKYKLGVVLEGYNNNLHKDKYKLGITFFDVCSGNKFRTHNERLITIEVLSQELLDKHRGWDNFYNEVPVIQNLMSFIETAADIPNGIAPSLIEIIMLCRIGRGVNFCNGVSPVGKQYYSHFFQILGDAYSPTFMATLTNYEIQRRLENNLCLNNCKEMIAEVMISIVNERLQECLQYLFDNFKKNGRAIFETKFKQLSTRYINWK